MSDDRHPMFNERYARGDMPWDSGITPPEIFAVLAALPAGNALDLGCGTGTVMRDLLLKGWHAQGVDFVQAAINLAEDKLQSFPGDSYRLFCHDVTELDALLGLRPSYDLIIDIGCGHCIDKSSATDYAGAIAARLHPGGTFMLYASHPRPDSTVGWTPDEVQRLFTPRLDIIWQQQGCDTAMGSPSGWYRMRKPSCAAHNVWT